ncbi:MAG TPA: tetratricopeptide repeat protein [Bacteroidetes bacterium]|nr:tetratricopeptide repeat protein [Bacteroidota bacterium]
MKNLTAILVILAISLSAKANFSPDSTLLQANIEYTEGNFKQAAQLYKLLVDSGYTSAELYYNLGNAYFKQGKIPQAILSYERAFLLNPSDEDIEFNLEYARTFTVDRIEVLPQFFLTKWYQSVRGLLGSNGWAWVSVGFVALLLVTALFFWFSYRSWVKRVAFILGLFFVLCLSLSVIFSLQEKSRMELRNKAIVFESVVTVKSSPGASSKDIFILHAGTKVQITKAIGEWVEIRIADGNKGWINSSAIELI